MKDLSNKEELMRDYWLNSLTDNQLIAFENEWFGNDEDSELLEIIRADLIGDYLGGDLRSDEKNLFEKHFLPANLDDVLLGKYSIELSRQAVEQKKIGFFERIAEAVRGFGRMPRTAFAAVALLLFLGIFAAVFIRLNNNESPLVAQKSEPENIPAGNIQNPPVNSEVVKEDQPIVNPTKKTDSKTIQTTNKSVASETVSPDENINRNKPEPSKNQILFLTILRGNGKAVKIADTTDNISLKLDMPGLDKAYKKYQVNILDGSGKAVLTQPIKENLSLKKSGETINLPNIKTGNFRKDEKYKAVLIGIDENGEEKQLSVYDSFEKN